MNDISTILNEKHIIDKLLFDENKKFEDILNINKKIYMVTLNDVIDIINNEDFKDGLYGFLNYRLDLDNDKTMIDSYEINNKKILKKDVSKLLEQNYGLLDLFSK